MGSIPGSPSSGIHRRVMQGFFHSNFMLHLPGEQLETFISRCTWRGIMVSRVSVHQSTDRPSAFCFRMIT